MKYKIYDLIKGRDFQTILEAGGNVGQDTRRLCRMFPLATVHTLEPVLQLYAGLKTLPYKNLKVYQVALSDHDGESDFYLDITSNGSYGASSVLPIDDDFKVYVDEEELIKVPCKKLSTFMDENGLDEVDFFWLDIEMMEYIVLKASEEVLHRIKNIYTEISYSKFRIGQPTYEELDLFLTGNGFKQVFIEPQGDESFLWQANSLYAR